MSRIIYKQKENRSVKAEYKPDDIAKLEAFTVKIGEPLVMQKISGVSTPQEQTAISLTINFDTENLLKEWIGYTGNVKVARKERDSLNIKTVKTMAAYASVLKQ